MGQKFLDSLTPLLVIQFVLSLIVVIPFAYQEIVVHSVDADLKLMAFGVIGYWLGGLSFAAQKALIGRSKSNDE